MPKLSGDIYLTGTLDELSFYKSGGETIVRRKWGPDKERLKKDPAYKPAYEHSLEFGESAKAAKLLRTALRNVIEGCFDNRVTPRLNRVMNAVKKFDTTSAPGKRNVGVGFEKPEACALLNGFNFNIHSPLEHLTGINYRMDTEKQLLYVELTNANLFDLPKGATHFVMRAGHAVIDFKTPEHTLAVDAIWLPCSRLHETHTLRLKNDPSRTGLHVFSLSVVFLQELNGTSIPLNDKSKNASAILHTTSSA